MDVDGAVFMSFIDELESSESGPPSHPQRGHESFHRDAWDFYGPMY
jgi:hypothetical protein